MLDAQTEFSLFHSVQESCAISDETVDVRSLTFQNHLTAARHVWFQAKETTVRLLDIHERMFPESVVLDWQESSRWRTEEAWIDTGHEGVQLPCPPPLMLRRKYEAHNHLADGLIRAKRGFPAEECERWCENIMLDVAISAPFADGNRRACRLYLNALRLRFGLPWLHINRAHQLRYEKLGRGFAVGQHL